MDAAEILGPANPISTAEGETSTCLSIDNGLIDTEALRSYSDSEESETGENHVHSTAHVSNEYLANEGGSESKKSCSCENLAINKYFEKAAAIRLENEAKEDTIEDTKKSSNDALADKDGSAMTAASPINQVEDPHVEDDGAVECRVCGEGEILEEFEMSAHANPMLAPCACRGSVAHIHLACLRQWVTTSSQQPALGGFEHTLKCNACLAPWRLGSNRQAIASSPTLGRFLADCVLPCCRPSALLESFGTAMSHAFLPPAPHREGHPCEEHLCCVILRLLAAAALAVLCLIQARVALVLIARAYAKFLVFDANLDRLLLPSLIEDWLEHNFPPLGCFEEVALPTLEVVTSRPFVIHASASVAHAFQRLPLVSLDDLVLAVIIQTLQAYALQAAPPLNQHPRARAPTQQSRWAAGRAVLAAVWLPRPYRDALIVWRQLFPTSPLLLHGLVSLPASAYVVRAWLHRWSILKADKHPLDLATGAGVGVLVLGLLCGLACASLALHALAKSIEAFSKWRASFALNSFFEALDACANAHAQSREQAQPSERDSAVENRTIPPDSAQINDVTTAAEATTAGDALAQGIAAFEQPEGVAAHAGALPAGDPAGNGGTELEEARNDCEIAEGSEDGAVDDEVEGNEGGGAVVKDEIHEHAHEELQADADRIDRREGDE